MGNLLVVAILMALILLSNDNRVVLFFLSLLWIAGLMLMVFYHDSPFHARPLWMQGVEAGMFLWFAMASVAKCVCKRK
jgi:hypothetical protein